MHFDDFEVDKRCLSVLKSQGIETPTPVQEKAIPVALTGKDVIAIAQTGTGKTLAFTLPALTRLAANPIAKNSVLILTPTRELAVQVHRVVEELGKPMNIRCTAVYGGAAIGPQTTALKKGSSVLVATPGRLLDHMRRKNIRFDQLDTLIFDEADRMLDMGFLPDIREIMRKLPKERQTLMFSATFPDEIARLAGELMRDPERVSVGLVAKPVELVNQSVYTVFPEDKARLLDQIFDEQHIESALVFTRTKDRTERLYRQLKKKGYKVGAIHGDRVQRDREKALDGFRNGTFKILIATDVASRGLDVEGISHVVNYDVPQSADDYIHRIGRTARANMEGDAITFVSPADHQALANIEKSIGRNIPRKDWEGAAPVLTLWRPNGAGAKGAARKSSSSRRRPRMLRR